MQTITMYIAFDGRRFFEEQECLKYETAMEAIAYNASNSNVDVASRLVAFLAEAKKYIDFADLFDSYTPLFTNHEPCAVQCSLWRVFYDFNYERGFPTLYSTYKKLAEEYAKTYGEPK